MTTAPLVDDAQQLLEAVVIPCQGIGQPDGCPRPADWAITIRYACICPGTDVWLLCSQDWAAIRALFSRGPVSMTCKDCGVTTWADLHRLVLSVEPVRR